MNEGLVPCGLNLQADVVTLRNGLSSILSLARQGTHTNNVEGLKKLLNQISEEVKNTIIDEEIAQKFVPTKVRGGYSPGLPSCQSFPEKIEWDESK